ncbi:MAG TPA: hypothetical protein PKL53_03275 [Methylotenera sp.]|nr:hypothetical protein [Methylotenera sp.]HPV45025.1 hypothetical protein [Methylotenera sp.]
MDILGSVSIWEILKHVRSWLANLDRAGKERKQQSIRALREVVIASRETAVYMRQMQDTDARNHESEAHLSVLWTNLGFELQDIGIDKLAKRCQIKGKHWANPDHYDDDFLKKADVSLDRMEKLANEILLQINR